MIKLLAFVAMLLSIIPNLPAHANGTDRGGGDRYEQEMKALGHAVADKLRSLKTEAATHEIKISPELLAIDLTAFDAAVDSVHVISTDETVYVEIEGKQVPREAANSANEHTIWVNRPMWDNPANDRISKQSIALHEYLGTMKVDRAYELSLFYRARLELEADTTQFKIDLTERTKDLGAALSDYFKVRFEPMFARLETMASMAEYQRCIDKKSDASEQERLADCFHVTAMILRAEKLTPVPADDPSAINPPHSSGSDVFIFSMMKEQYHCGWPHPRALFNWLFDPYRKWQVVCPKIDMIIDAIGAPKKIEDPSIQRQMTGRFLDWANKLPQPRQAYAIQVYSRLVNEFNASHLEIHNKIQSFNGSTNAACPGDLADGIRCAIPRLIDSVSTELEPQMHAKQKHLAETVGESVRAIADYTE